MRSEIATTVFMNLKTSLDVSAPPKCQQLAVDTASDPRRHESLVEIYLVCPREHVKVLANDTHEFQEKLNIFVYLRKATLSRRVLALTHAGFLSDS